MMLFAVHATFAAVMLVHVLLWLVCFEQANLPGLRGPCILQNSNLRFACSAQLPMPSCRQTPHMFSDAGLASSALAARNAAAVEHSGSCVG